MVGHGWTSLNDIAYIEHNVCAVMPEPDGSMKRYLVFQVFSKFEGQGDKVNRDNEWGNGFDQCQRIGTNGM